MSSKSRRTKHNRDTRNDRKDKKARSGRNPTEVKVQRGLDQLAQDRRKKEFDKDWNLDWFQPEGKQEDIVSSFHRHTFTIVDAPSGCGKTSASLWLALSGLKVGDFQKLVFIKNPTETGDDQIGYLSGGETDKLKAHYETTRFLFHEFIPKQKLEADEGSGKIKLSIPNFLLGATLDFSVVILDECQLMSDSTMKLLLERCGTDTKYLILGDSRQRYAVKKRSDGFKDLVEKVTDLNNGIRYNKYDQVGYVRMDTDNNMRSEGSKFITKLYEGEF